MHHVKGQIVNKMFKKHLWDFSIIIFIFLFDRVSKLLIIGSPEVYEQYGLSVTSFLNFNLIWNEGIAFGLFSFDNKFYYNLLTILICSITIIIIWLLLKSEGLERLSFLMIVGGSLGNIFDRIFYSAVPDFIDIYINNFHWFIFNVADIFISLGILCLISLEIIGNKKKKMKTISNILIIFIASLFLFSCSGSLDGFKMKKKSAAGDEFLIQKKDPLVLPPDFSKLPGPDEEIKEKNDEVSQIEMVFKKDNSNEQENENIKPSDSGLEKSILKKIQKQ